MGMHHKEQPNKFLTGLQHVSKGIGTVKGLYDMGKMPYGTYRAVASFIQTAATMLI